MAVGIYMAGGAVALMGLFKYLLWAANEPSLWFQKRRFLTFPLLILAGCLASNPLCLPDKPEGLDDNRYRTEYALYGLVVLSVIVSLGFYCHYMIHGEV
ncbi:hypothetical protein [Neptuniibacter sp. QD37_11]|uniref:hypothetical protein n=1 Tax=Neptuniibacter sp. QD37_11 TaxID=3398209 RepID=UPI0039F4E885